MKNRLTYFFLLICCPLMAQQKGAVPYETALKELQAVALNYAGYDFRMDFVKKTYMDISNSEPMSVEQGSISRGKGFEYRLEQNGSILVQNNSGKLIIDSAEMVVLLNPVDSIFNAVDMNAYFTKDVKDKYSFERKEEGAVVSYIITTANAAEGTTTFTFGKSDFLLRSMKIVLPRSNYFNESLDDTTEESPLITITYSGFRSLKTTGADLFVFDQWITKVNNVYVLKQPMENFTLYDLRMPDNQ